MFFILNSLKKYNIYNNYSKITDNIFLGNKYAAFDRKFLEENEIKVIVNCSKNIDFIESDYYIKHRIPVNDDLSNVSINLYQTPNTTNTQINYNYIGRIQDAGSYTNQPDAPFRFLPCMVSGLAFYLSQKKNPQMTQTLKLYYEDELQRALTEDGQRASVHIVPQNYYVGS